MSRLTGSDALGLIEAYSAIYSSEEEEVIELTEEEIQEDFENWVNSLVEEGYDLSEYTWEDMYEEYLNEMGQRPTTGQAKAPISNAPYQSRFARPMNAGTPQQTGRGTAVSRPQIGGLPANYRGQELQQAARARASQVGTPRQGSAGSGAAPSAAARRPVPAPTRPVPSATARPGSVMSRPAPTTTARTTAPASARPASAAPAQTSTQSPVLGYQLAQRGTNIGSNILQQQRPSLAQQAAELRAMRQASQQRQGLTQSFDPFDVVMGHLIDEGYAENEEAAAVIMANMSEEWREEILEGFMNQEN